jgi:hypothetical protein
MANALLFLLLFCGVPVGVAALRFISLGPSPLIMAPITAVIALALLAHYRRDASYYHPTYTNGPKS